jgi:hypothetical protein
MTATIDKQIWKHSVHLGLEGHYQWQEMHNWCKEQFGAEQYTWTGSLFWFQNERDAIVFMLRWG